jgi:Kef-type K+ transport system membrane component KefB
MLMTSEIDDRSEQVPSATATVSGVGDLVPVDPDPPRFRQARFILLAEGVVLIALGIWAAIAAAGYHGTAPDGAAVLGMRFTMIHALVILGTGVLALVATADRRLGLAFAALQTVAYLLVFIISAGDLNSFSDGADSILHGVLATVGLVLVMWIAARALNGTPFRRVRNRSNR